MGVYGCDELGFSSIIVELHGGISIFPERLLRSRPRAVLQIIATTEGPPLASVKQIWNPYIQNAWSSTDGSGRMALVLFYSDGSTR